MATLPVGFIISLVMLIFILWQVTLNIQLFREQIDVINITLFTMSQKCKKYMKVLLYSNISW